MTDGYYRDAARIMSRYVAYVLTLLTGLTVGVYAVVRTGTDPTTDAAMVAIAAYIVLFSTLIMTFDFAHNAGYRL